MAEIYAACAAVLKPGGFLVAVTKDLRERGGLRDLAGDTIALCRAAGLEYWQHVIALLASIRDGQLVPYPSFFQLTQTRKAVARGDRTALVAHEDVLVFRKSGSAAKRGGAGGEKNAGSSMSAERKTATSGDELAAEIKRYLGVVERFAALGADPHAEARARAAHARANELAARRSAAAPARRRLFR